MKTIVSAMLAALITMPAHAGENSKSGPDKEATNIATGAWIRCQDFTAQKLVRAYGKSADPASIADMVMAECYEFEDMVKRAVFGDDDLSDEAKILFADYKMEIHGSVTKVVVKLMEK